MLFFKKNRVLLILIVIVIVSFFIIPTSVDAAWFNSNYNFCRKLTMTAGGGSGGVATTTTAGFALVATSTISTLAATSSSGNIFETSTASGTTTPVDVTVTNGTDCNSDGGSQIDFYFEKYVQTTGEFVLWVEPTDISSTTAKTVLLYYGYSDASATDQSNEAGVFGALNEGLVWNLHEDPTSAGVDGILDSTSNNHDGTDQGSMDTADQVLGQVDGSLNFDGTNDNVAETSPVISDTPLTISTWFKADQLATEKGDQMAIWAHARSDATFSWWRIRVESDDDRINASCRNGGTIVGFDSTTVIQSQRWYHLVYVESSPTDRHIYINGSLENSNSTSCDPTTVDQHEFHVGWNQNGSQDRFDGDIDDVRVYPIALHAMDILTIYNNTLDSTTFWTFGTEETELTAPTVTTNAATNVTDTTATINGNITDTGGENANERGFAWGTVSTLSGGDTATTTSFGDFGTGAFSSGLTDLTSGVTYYFRAYAANTIGTSTGSILNFTTTVTVTKIIRLLGGVRLRGVRLF